MTNESNGPGTRGADPQAARLEYYRQRLVVLNGLPADTPFEDVWATTSSAVRVNDYMGGKMPTIPQAAFMIAPEPEVFFGGAAGGGKSAGLLMAALQYVDIEGYAALIVRRTFQQLSKPGGLMSKAREWLTPTDARWQDETRTWRFPSGATLTFGHLENPGTGPEDLGDEINFQGQEYQFVGPDELPQLPKPWPYLFLLTRLRRLKDAPVPVRMRPTGNPGGVGHAWVKARWGLGRDATGVPLPPPPAGRRFMPAFGTDNPHLDWESYLRGLRELDAVTQAQLIAGNWDVQASGDLFRPERIRVLGPDAAAWLQAGMGVQAAVLYWDKAATAGGGAYSTGVLLARVDRAIYGVGWIVVHVWRGQWSVGYRNRIMRQAVGILRPQEPIETMPAALGVPRWVVWVEQEPGSGGVESAQVTLDELVAPNVEAHAERPTGAKADRARPFAVAVENWQVGVVAAPWNAAYFDELRAAPHGVYWDQIDASAGGFNKLQLARAPVLPGASAGVGRLLPAPSWGRPLLPAGRPLGRMP